MTKIFVTRDIPDEGLKMLRERPDIQLDVYEENKKIPVGILKSRVQGVDVILSLLTDQIDSSVMRAAGKQLKMIANYAVGFDNIDLDTAKKRGIVVTNARAPEVSETVAEHAIALIFALANRIVETDDFARAGKYKGWGPKMFLGTDVIGKTLGIIGGGAIGEALARRMHDGFGIKIIYNDVKRNDKFEQTFGAEFKEKDELLKLADFVSLHVPLLPSTRHLIGERELQLMKKTAYLINTARGPIVDETALVKALAHGDIAGAGLDVYECEPMIACNPKEMAQLRALPNVVLTPHTASATIEARQAMSRTAAANILAFIDGQIPPNAIK